MSKNNSLIRNNLSIFLIWIIGLIIVLLVPDNLIAALSKVVELIDLTGMMKHYASKSSFPKLALVYNFYIFAFSPVYFLHGLRYWESQTQGGLATRLRKRTHKLTFSDYLLLYFCGLLFFCLGIAGFLVWNGSNTRLFNFADSKLTLGLFGMFIPFYSCNFLAASILSIKKIFSVSN